MIRFLLIVIFASLIFIGTVSWKAEANVQQALKDLRFQFENYTKTHQEYRLAKTKYKQFQTLPAEVEAFDSLKKILKARAQVLSAYFSLLQEKLNQTPAIPDQNRNQLTAQISSARSYLSEFEKKAENFKNLTEAENLSKEFEKKKEEWEAINLKLKGVVFSSKLVDLSERLNKLTQKTENFLSSNRQSVPDLNLREEKISITYSKIVEAKDAAQKAQGAFFTMDPGEAEYFANENSRLAKNLLEQAVLLITEAARGF